MSIITIIVRKLSFAKNVLPQKEKKCFGDISCSLNPTNGTTSKICATNLFMYIICVALFLILHSPYDSGPFRE